MTTDLYPTKTRLALLAEVRAEEAAGWVQQDSSGVFWRLTDAGREVLKAAVDAS